MDLNLDYSDDESPLSLKSDFILSLCELIVGGKEGLQPVQKTIIAVSYTHLSGCWQSGTSGFPMICGSWTMITCTASCKVTG